MVLLCFLNGVAKYGQIFSATRFARASGADVLYIDKGVIVLNKPSGLVSQLQKNKGMTTSKGLDGAVKGLMRKYSLSSQPYPVHRLDKLTTGVLTLARTPAMSRELSRQLQDRKVEKSYLALVRAGAQTFEKSGEYKGRIKRPIQYTDGRASLASHGEPSITEWEHIATSEKCPLSLVRFNLITGHKHQLRIHASHVLGAPILGDSLYSDTAGRNHVTRVLEVPAERLFLHASSMTFSRYRPTGPQKKLQLTVYAPLPEDFVNVCSQAGLVLPSQAVNGGIFVDGQHLESGLLPELDGQWMPRPVSFKRAE